ncbi:MAG: DUF1569 domain-containing protein [Planctomycetaceae bacterium]
MPARPIPRRRLDFRSWDALLADAEHLARDGYERAGRWSLAQALDHVGAGLRVALAGSTNRLPWPMRMSARSFALPVMRAWRWIPAGIPAPTWWQPQVPADADDATALARFRTEVAAFRAHEGPYQPHPAFDRLTREDYEDLMLIHASHHLGFLVPRAVPRA